MKIQKLFRIALFVSMLTSAAFVSFAQPQLLKRTTYKTDKFDFGSGGTVEITGSPIGSIRVEGGTKNEIEISAEIEVQASNEADLAKLSELTSYVLDDTPGRASITSFGLNDRKSLPKALKKLPKNLIGLPYKIDYVIKVPRYCDLQVDGGKGDLSVTGVEGAIKVNFLIGDSKIALIGGGLNATFGTGTVDVSMPDRSWRGSTIDVALSSGTISVHLPANVSADLDASVVKTGSIENGLGNLKPRDRKIPITDKLIAAKAGNGGVAMKFTVGDGTLKLIPIAKPQ
ncbi:MAG: hypothetical protein ABI878_12355 [Acidobacteriota bacterium]